MSPVYYMDEFFLDRVFQPIGDWSHQRFGIHPQQIAEFFGLGAILDVLVQQMLHITEIAPTPLSVLSSCLAVGVPILFFLVIRKRVRIIGGRNSKRITLSYLRIIYFLFTLVFIAELAILPRKQYVDHTLGIFAMLFIWLGVSFASLDEPPPRQYRKSIFGWAS